MRTEGTIVRLEPGLGFVKVTDEQGNTKGFPFTFDKIKGYGGRPLLDLGVGIHSRVTVEIENDKIVAVEFPEKDRSARKRSKFREAYEQAKAVIGEEK